MKKFNKTNLLSTTVAIATVFMSTLSNACPANEVCDGLNVTTNSNRVINIEGLGVVDLKKVNVTGIGEVKLEAPKNIGSVIEQNQVNSGNVKAELDYKGDFIKGDYAAKVNAIGNNIGIEKKGGLGFEGSQKNTGDITATVDSELSHLVEIKNVSFDVVALANNASFTSDGGIVGDLAQINSGKKVTASLDTTLRGQGALADALLEVDVTALGNNLSITNDALGLGSYSQENCADISAIAKIDLAAFKDPISVSAIGNNFQVSPPKIVVGN